METEKQRVEQRRADLVVKVRGAEGPFLLHIEIQNDNQREMPWRMLRYRTDIALAHPTLAVLQYLIYIGRMPLSMADGIEEPGLSYRYQLLDMHTIDCERLLSQDNPDALVMAILCDFKGRPERVVVRYILERLQALVGEDEARFRDYLLMLEILSTNRDLQHIVQEEETMLSQVKYSDLPSYGLGMQQGIRQGEAAVLLRQLEKRFAGELLAEHRERIRQADAETLLVWAERVLTAESLDAVFH